MRSLARIPAGFVASSVQTQVYKAADVGVGDTNHRYDSISQYESGFLALHTLSRKFSKLDQYISPTGLV